MRVERWRWVLLLAPLAIGLLCLQAADAESGPKSDEEQSLYFSLPASNGYTASVSIQSPSGRSEESAFVNLVLSRRSQSALYSVTGTRIENQVRANFGPLGSLDLTYVDSGQTSKSQSVSFSGRFQFRGEHGYTQLSATSIRGSTSAPGPQPSVAFAPRSRPSDLGDRVLEARYGGPRGSLIFGASMSAPGQGRRRPEFIAIATESRGSMEILRAVSGTGANSDLRVSGAADSEIVVQPPSPFSGEAVLSRRAGQEPAWTGDLVAAFPGRQRVTMAGARFTARLVSPQAHASAFDQTPTTSAQAISGLLKSSASDVPSAAEGGAGRNDRCGALSEACGAAQAHFLLPGSPRRLATGILGP